MAIYRIKPEKDTFISSEPTISGVYRNAGNDPILQIGGYPDLNGVGRTNRSLLKFNSSEINTGLSLAGSNYTSSLKLYLADAQELPTSFTIYCHPISSSWDSGIGQYNDEPVKQSGATWIAKTISSNWGTAGGDYLLEYTSSITLNDASTFDLTFDVSNYIAAISSSTITDNGLIVKLEDTYENYTSQSIELNYYGKESHTIFKPYLEFSWDDSSYSIGSLNTLDTDNCIIRVNNLKEEYKNLDKTRFRISSRPQFPTLAFETSSVKTNYALPQSSYWGIKDEFTNEMIVNFSDNTKISADSTGSYFDMYLSSFNIQRYYRVIFKTTIGESTFYVEDDKPFKVVK